MFNYKKKKGFTIVELIVVIAVIAVLASVLIPTFSGVIQKARLSNDDTLAKSLNVCLASDEHLNGNGNDRITAENAVKVASDNGYDLKDLTASADGYALVWDENNNTFKVLAVNEDGALDLDDGVDPKSIWLFTEQYDPNLEAYSQYIKAQTPDNDSQSPTPPDSGDNNTDDNLNPEDPMPDENLDLEGTFAGGDGTEDSPYLIATPEQFNNMYVEFKAQFDEWEWCDLTYFKLARNIDFSDTEIDNSNAEELELPVNFDGSGCTISNISQFSGVAQLFPKLYDESKIKNVTFDFDINTLESTALCGESMGVVSFDNVTIKGDIKSTGNQKSAAGFVIVFQDTSLTFTNCTNEANITANEDTGTAAAFVANPSIIISNITFNDCQNTGSINAAIVRTFKDDREI